MVLLCTCMGVTEGLGVRLDPVPRALPDTLALPGILPLPGANGVLPLPGANGVRCLNPFTLEEPLKQICIPS